MQKILGLSLLLIAYLMLYPGLTEPMLTVTGTVEKMKLVELGKDFLDETPTKLGLVGDMAKMMLGNMKVEGTVPAFDKTRSILGTVKDLHESNNTLVAFLIVTFSVIIPVIKGVITLATLVPIPESIRQQLNWIGGHMSKWSMADVFVIAIFLGYLAAMGIREDTGLVSFDASLGRGFYFFLGYCLLSILSSHVLNYKPRLTKRSNAARTAKSPELPKQRSSQLH